jgi:hypothetical protein
MMYVLICSNYERAHVRECVCVFVRVRVFILIHKYIYSQSQGKEGSSSHEEHNAVGE